LTIKGAGEFETYAVDEGLKSFGIPKSKGALKIKRGVASEAEETRE